MLVTVLVAVSGQLLNVCSSHRPLYRQSPTKDRLQCRNPASTLQTRAPDLKLPAKPIRSSLKGRVNSALSKPKSASDEQMGALDWPTPL